MITEDYVSFETAKLLKEKGFDCNTNCYYIEDSVTRALFYSPVRENHNTHIENNELDIHINISSGKISAPTRQMAMKWLREKHNLFIGCVPRLSFTDFYWITSNIYRVRKKSSLYHTENVDDYNCVASCDSHSYEEACEEAIKYCLENLI